MPQSFKSRFLHRVFRKLSRIQARGMTTTLRIQNKLIAKYDTNLLKIPICISTGFDNISWGISWKTELIDRLYDADHGTFVDVGVNVGQTMLDLYAVRKQADYIGFEPNIACAFYATQLIKVNSLNRWRIIPVALTDKTLCLPMYRESDIAEDSGATILPDLRPGRSFDIEFIAGVAFDDVKHSLGVEDINFVKIDVEGAELEALRGMRKTLNECRPFVLCEVLFTDVNADIARHRVRNQELTEFLCSLNYSVLQLIKSEDGTHVISITIIKTFPSEYWSVANKHLCDYLFVPQEKVTQVAAILSQT